MDLRERLINLGAEVLADTLLASGEDSKAVSAVIERLTSTPAENAKRCKAKLSGLKRMRRYVPWGESSAFADKLLSILADLESGISEPQTGVDLACAFLETDNAVIGCCDDSSGIIGGVYRSDACRLFVHYAQQCDDRQWLFKRILKLFKEDQYSLRLSVIEQASDYLAAEDMRCLCQLFWDKAQKQSDGEKTNQLLYAVQSLAKLIKDPDLYVRAWSLNQSATPGSVNCLDFARVYHAAGAARAALGWLQQAMAEPGWWWEDCARLLVTLWRELGDDRQALHAAQDLFRSSRNLADLELLLELDGEDRRAHYLDQAEADIRASKHYNLSDSFFLYDAGRIDAAAAQIIRHVGGIEGRNYDDLRILASHMTKADKPLATSVVYRALLDSILAKANPKAYHYGARYLRQLNDLARQVDDWRGVVRHARSITWQPTSSMTASIGSGRNTTCWRATARMTSQDPSS